MIRMYMRVTEMPNAIFNPPLIFISPDDVQIQKVSSKRRIKRQKNIDPVITRYFAITGTLSQ